MGRDVDLTDNGALILREAVANGVAAVTVDAPADLTGVAGSYAMELLDQLPAGTEFLQITAAGKWVTNAGVSGTLDASYDSGGPGAGRVITADAGPLEIAGADGIQVTHTDPSILFETTGAGDYNWRVRADSSSFFSIARGDLDADVSDDTFDTLLTVDATNKRVGINQAVPVATLHIEPDTTGDSSVLMDTTGGSDDPYFQLQTVGVDQFAFGYDGSASRFEIWAGGWQAGGTQVMAITRSGLDMMVGSGTPSARLHVLDSGSRQLLVESTATVAGISLESSGSSTTDQVAVQGFGNDMRLLAGASVLVYLDGADDRVAIGNSAPGAKLEIQSNVAAQITCLVNNEHASGRGLVVDSETTDNPLIELLPLTGNARGDVNWSTARTAAPSSPDQGDMWYDGTRDRWEVRTTLTTRNLTFAGRFTTMNFFSARNAVANVLTVEESHVRVGTTATINTITSSLAEVGDRCVFTANTGVTATFAHAADNILLDGAANKAVNPNDTLELMYNGTDWIQVSFSDNS